MTRTALRRALLAAWLLAAPAAAADHAIFVDGSYSPGREDSAMDRVIDGRLAEADRIMSGRHPGSERTTVDEKEELREALGRIQCRCGDTVTVFLMGHGARDRFVFSKASGSDRSLGAAELAGWLEGAAKECCCKIRVVLFSCHSGSFLDELLAQPHVDSVWTSSAASEKSYSEAAYAQDGSFRDGGDWMKGFLDDWQAAPGGDSLGDALQRSSESAEEKMPERFTGDQHPTGWRRGEQPVVAHVEARPRQGKLKVHFFSPEFMRSRTLDLDVRDVALPENLVVSNWVTFPGTFGRPDQPPTVSGPVARTEPPRQTVLAHVQGRGTKGGRRYLTVHTVRPKWLYSKKQRLWLTEAEHLPEGLGTCNWIEGEVAIEDPEGSMSTTGALRRSTPEFSAKVHATGTINPHTGIFEAHVLDPSWLRCQRRTVQLPAGERGLLRELRECDNVLVTLDIADLTAGTYPGRGAFIVRRDRGEWSPRFDVATNLPGERAFVVGLADEGEERLVTPAVGVTNVGSEPASFPVRAALGRAEDEAALREWLNGEGGRPGYGVMWSGEARLDGLAPADTADAVFGPWQPPAEGGRFWVGFRSLLEGDENPASDLRGLVFAVPPSPSEEEPAGVQDLDLGTLRRGIYPFPITAVNSSCRGRHDFRVRFEPEGTTAAWLRIEGPDTLRGIGAGDSKTTNGVVDLRDAPAGPLAGTLRITCLTCPPPPVCTQDETVFRLRVLVAE